MNVRARACLLSTLFLLPAAALPLTAVDAQTPKAPLASIDSMWPGVAIDVTEFKRKGSTLSAKIRLRNTGSSEAKVDVKYDDVYVLDLAGGKRYEVLRDDQGAVIAAHLPGNPERWYGTLPAGGGMTLWMKFPAPPAQTTSASLVVGANEPFEDLTIEDA